MLLEDYMDHDLNAGDDRRRTETAVYCEKE
jgi:hypothetical protein